MLALPQVRRCLETHLYPSVAIAPTASLPDTADYFRHIDRRQVGDTVQLTNLWETLTYTVTDIQIIRPQEVEKIKIQPNCDLLTLLTCHPYASGGRQRHVVVCERVVT